MMDYYTSGQDEVTAQLLQERPWHQCQQYFRKVHISALALAKMTQHASQGGRNEVMGVMTGRLRPNTFVVLDAYALPVEATETRVNAMGEAYEYMVRYLEGLQVAGHSENVVGWYHSHPGYGCWLSRIDVGTQEQNQAFQDPFLAVVIDPDRTASSGHVEIGAFRTMEPDSSSQVDHDRFGVYADRYYPLSVTYFRSPCDEMIVDTMWTDWAPGSEAAETEAAASATEVEAVAHRVEQLAQIGGGSRPDTNDLIVLASKSARKLLARRPQLF